MAMRVVSPKRPETDSGNLARGRRIGQPCPPPRQSRRRRAADPAAAARPLLRSRHGFEMQPAIRIYKLLQYRLRFRCFLASGDCRRLWFGRLGRSRFWHCGSRSFGRPDTAGLRAPRNSAFPGTAEPRYISPPPSGPRYRRPAPDGRHDRPTADTSDILRPASIFSTGSKLLVTPSIREVDGISCISPSAPLWETA